MPSTHSCILMHVIFSTKNRFKCIGGDWEPDFYGYLGGVAHEHQAFLLDAGGVADHVHLLLRTHPSFAISDTVRLLKANSSRWINDERKIGCRFEWQKGYGVFSVSQSNRVAVLRYIANQKEHHKKEPFEQEYLRILDLAQVEYRKEFVFDEEVAG